MNLGRHQLLQWVNSLTQADYPSIESLADGIAYCQIFEAIHPGSINVSRLTFVTKLPLDCLKNLKILESSLKNMKITMTVSIDKMANGKFQDNIIFTQWLYAHAMKYGKDNIENYQAFQRRSQILEKQGKRWDEVNVHLLPNEAYKYHDQQQQDQQYFPQTHQQSHPYQARPNAHIQRQEQNLQLEQRIDEIANYITSLQCELKQKMELNWRTMHMIGKSIDERNLLYGLLEQIEKVALGGGDSPVQKEILRILYDKSEEGRPM